MSLFHCLCVSTVSVNQCRWAGLLHRLGRCMVVFYRCFLVSVAAEIWLLSRCPFNLHDDIFVAFILCKVKRNWAASWENRLFAYAKTKTQISFAVTAKLISAFVFVTRIVQSLYFLNPKFHASRNLQLLYSPFCVGPGRKPRRRIFSERGSIKRSSIKMGIWG